MCLFKFYINFEIFEFRHRFDFKICLNRLSFFSLFSSLKTKLIKFVGFVVLSLKKRIIELNET